MPRPTDEQLLEVSRLCIAYLHDKHSTELGLFRSSVAQTDVRALQTQIIQFGQNKFRDDPDPHLVAEVLQTCFKNLTYPLLHEVYQDIVHTDLDDEDMDLSETTIQSWITKLPTVKFHLTSALFRLLSRLAGIDESDSNLIQLAYCIAPSICRPINSAYMSIRHMEDLRKIRPVISFIMENYDEIFTDELGPASPIKSYNSTRDLGGLTNDKTEDISNMMSSSMVIDTTMFRAASTESNDFREFGFSKDDASVSSMDESIDDVPSEHKGVVDLNSLSPRSLALIRPNLKLTIPTSSPPSNAPLEAAPLFALSPSNSMVSTDSESSSSSSSSLLHYTDAEWSILEALLMNTACSFLELDSTSTKSEAMQVSDSGGSQQPQSPPLAGTRLSAAPSSTPPSSSSSANTGTTGPATQAGTEAAGPETTASSGAGGSQASNGGKHRRRKMVSDCKAMRVQIFDFEQEWTKKHNRIPKSFERGSMESVYTRYRKLKKEIRDISATDLQRALRGFMSRKRYGRIGPLRWGVSSGTTDKSLLGAAAGKSTAGSTTKRADFSANFFVPPQSSGADSVLGSQIPATLYASYREILEKKRDLKRRLKKFDEDFFENWGRNPKKSDKEVIRPLYQSYHEIKAKLDEMRGSIEASHGPLPEDLQEDGARTGSNSLAPSLASSPAKPGDSTGLLDSSAAAKYLSDDEEGDGHKDGGSKQQFGAAGRNNGVYSDNKTVGAAMGLGESKGYQFSGSKFINIESELEALQLEKRNLHSYLKVYERDFSRMHGRPVTKHADIQPVAHEYQRYKELKNLIKEKKLQAK